MTKEEKIAAVARNFIRFCESSKLENAFVVIQFEKYWFGTLMYKNGLDDAVISGLHDAVIGSLKDVQRLLKEGFFKQNLN